MIDIDLFVLSISWNFSRHWNEKKKTIDENEECAFQKIEKAARRKIELKLVKSFLRFFCGRAKNSQFALNRNLMCSLFKSDSIFHGQFNNFRCKWNEDIYLIQILLYLFYVWDCPKMAGFWRFLKVLNGSRESATFHRIPNRWQLKCDSTNGPHQNPVIFKTAIKCTKQ